MHLSVQYELHQDSLYILIVFIDSQSSSLLRAGCVSRVVRRWPNQATSNEGKTL